MAWREGVGGAVSRRRRRNRREALKTALAVVALAAFALLASVKADAASTLIGLHAAPAENGTSQVVLDFSGGVPSYRVFGDGTADITVLLVGSLRSTAVGVPVISSGFIRGVTTDALGGAIAVGIHLNAPATARVLTSGGASLAVIVAAAPAAGAATAPFGIPAANRPAAPPAVASGTITEVVRLRYADVSEIVGVLDSGQAIAPNDTFVANPTNFGGASLGSVVGGTISYPIAATAGVSSYGGQQSLGQRINDHVAIDRRLNAIVLTGTPEEVAAIKATIAKIDVPLPSVIVEAQIVELTDSAAKDLGIDFTGGGGPVASATYGIKSLTTGEGSVTLQAALYDQVSHGQGRIIATPRIVAQSGQSASILTGDALPIVTSLAISGVNAVQQQVQYVNVGVSVQIEPRISDDGNVTSHIFAEVSSVTGFIQSYPRISQRQAQTTASVMDGQSFVIGGLLQQSDISNLQKVPGFGDLPLVGGLFRLHTETAQSTNLYIVVTPHIVHKRR